MKYVLSVLVPIVHYLICKQHHRTFKAIYKPPSNPSLIILLKMCSSLYVFWLVSLPKVRGQCYSVLSPVIERESPHQV